MLLKTIKFYKITHFKFQFLKVMLSNILLSLRFKYNKDIFLRDIKYSVVTFKKKRKKQLLLIKKKQQT